MAAAAMSGKLVTETVAVQGSTPGPVACPGTTAAGGVRLTFHAVCLGSLWVSALKCEESCKWCGTFAKGLSVPGSRQGLLTDADSLWHAKLLVTQL